MDDAPKSVADLNSFIERNFSYDESSPPPIILNGHVILLHNKHKNYPKIADTIIASGFYDIAHKNLLGIYTKNCISKFSTLKKNYMSNWQQLQLLLNTNFKGPKRTIAPPQPSAALQIPDHSSSLHADLKPVDLRQSYFLDHSYSNESSQRPSTPSVLDNGQPAESVQPFTPSGQTLRGDCGKCDRKRKSLSVLESENKKLKKDVELAEKSKVHKGLQFGRVNQALVRKDDRIYRYKLKIQVLKKENVKLRKEVTNLQKTVKETDQLANKNKSLIKVKDSLKSKVSCLEQALKDKDKEIKTLKVEVKSQDVYIEHKLDKNDDETVNRLECK